MPSEPHQSKKVESVGCAVLTISDTRTPDSDSSGALIRESLKSLGHEVLDYKIVPDDPDAVREALQAYRDDDRVQAVLTTGGTGLAIRDNTYEAVESLLTKRLDGFGELFRALSFDSIGSAAMLSRAVGGVMGRTVVFSMPGSINAVRLAMQKLVLPELAHVVYLATH